MPIFVVAASGGTPERLCDDCGEVKEWSPAGDQILYVTTRDPSSVGLLKIGSSYTDAWLSNARFRIYNPRVSSDGGWITFNGRTDRLAPRKSFVAKVQESVVAAEKEWIVISNASLPARSNGRGTDSPLVLL
jgi:Tol biopolymer transport system component